MKKKPAPKTTAPAKKAVDPLFTVTFANSAIKPLAVPGLKLQEFITKEKRAYTIINDKGQPCFRKTYNG